MIPADFAGTLSLCLGFRPIASVRRTGKRQPGAYCPETISSVDCNGMRSFQVARLRSWFCPEMVATIDFRNVGA
jgi:hypothetical protein